MKKAILFIIAAILLVACAQAPATKEISYTDLRSKIAGAWLGQMVGNIYGLEYENDFVDEPGEGPFTFEKSISKMTAVDGAFSDDDTDVEYMYLLMMEKYGVEPTYAQMREGWMYHIRDRVWLANRASLGLMHYGLTPPFTGDMRYNPHWFQIDPQLINEIWSYTAPGMPAYAAGISEWAARITSDSWATSPTVVYGAMYSNAFFESDTRKLVEEAVKYLPEGDRFANTVNECLALYDKYPDDWRAARKEIAQKYWFDEPDLTKTIWNANLNGAMGILSILYGEGDMAKTLEIGCALGFDADNQTATICGILGVIGGEKCVPTEYSMPFEHWTKPFNDRYINVTRYDMPDASIEDMIDRTVALAVKIVENNGGRTIERDGEKYLVINTGAKFHAPLEFCVGPDPVIVSGEPVDYEFFCVTNKDYTWKLVGGELPAGLTFKKGTLSGTTTAVGNYTIKLSLSNGKDTIEKEFDLVVRGRNIAPDARIIASATEANFDVLDSCWTTNSHSYYAKTVDVINDGKVNGEGSVFYSLTEKSNAPKEDWFGYEWDEPVTAGMISFHYGCLEEFGGWYSDMHVEARDAEGNWVPVEATISPALPETDAVFIQPHFADFLFTFAEPVTATAFRVIGHDKVEIHWNKYTKNVSSFISISELQVYEAE